MLRVRGLVVIAMALLCVGCLAPRSADMANVDGRCWESAAEIKVENIDTISLRNIAVAIRYNSNFGEATLPLNIKVVAPDGRTFEEPFTLHLEGVKRATTISQSVAIPYRLSALLATNGLYTFIIEPCAVVKGVEAIGVEITEIKD